MAEAFPNDPQAYTEGPEAHGPSLSGVQQAWTQAGISHHVAEEPGLIRVSKIVVPPERRGQGVGTQAMRQLTDYADTTGQRVALSPSKDFGATSKARLTDFYKRQGFRSNKGRSQDFSVSESMIREPRGR